MKPNPATATMGQILGYVVRSPRLWPGFGRMLAAFAAVKVRLHLACWSSGYTVREVRRMAREGRVTTT